MVLNGALECSAHFGRDGYGRVGEMRYQFLGRDDALIGILAGQVAWQPVNLFGAFKAIFVVVQHVMLPAVGQWFVYNDYPLAFIGGHFSSDAHSAADFLGSMRVVRIQMGSYLFHTAL